MPDLNWYTSIAGVVAVTMLLVSVLKRAFGNRPYINTVPTWLYAVVISGGLTVLTSHVWGTLQGDLWQNLMQAIGMAAMASGFYEWLNAPTKPLAESAIKAGVTVEQKNAPNRINAAELTVDLKKVGPLLLLLALALGCASNPPPTLSPEGVAAFNALRVGHALDIVRDTAIDAEANGLISRANATKVVNWHEAAVKVIVAVPGGWKPTVLAGLDQLKGELPPGEWQRIALYVDLVKTIIKEVVP